jgi:DNA-binding response OmpR family regulator
MSDKSLVPESSPKADSLTVAVIDDDRITANGFAAFVESLGFKSAVFAGPRQALLKIGQTAPDLIMLDINMPGMDGYDVCRYLRREAATARTPIVVVSAHSSERDKALAFEAGANAYLVKPVTLAALKLCLRNFLPVEDDAVH